MKFVQQSLNKKGKFYAKITNGLFTRNPGKMYGNKIVSGSFYSLSDNSHLSRSVSKIFLR